ncbi:hypothetical protein GCM10023333_01720 [Ferrimonas pelagia]|uniref:Transposase n=1 Tax=Ferrimonas pelagia TaxID=1177826 RepID=A0ABP9E9W5_9GAMM
MMQALAERAMLVFQQQVEGPLPDRLTKFRRVLLQDGSSFALHDDLKYSLPGRFKAYCPAAV